MASAEILRQIVASGFIEGLRLPKFPDLQASAAAAYATRQYAPCGWLEAGLRTGGSAVMTRNSTGRWLTERRVTEFPPALMTATASLADQAAGCFSIRLSLPHRCGQRFAK